MTHGDDKARRQPRGLRATDAAADGNEPVDLGALQADDALLDALGSGDPHLAGQMSEHQLNALLLSWRHEVDSEPIPELVDTDAAVREVAIARNRRSTARSRFLVPLTSAAAVLLIAFTVVGFAARSAEPGDTLWGITQVLYSDHAKSVEAAATARQDLAQARALLRSGDFTGARTILDRVTKSIDAVQGEDGKANLLAARAQLVNQLQHPGQVSQTPTTVPNFPPPATSNVPSPDASSSDGSQATTPVPPPVTTPPMDTTTPPTTPPSTPPSTPSSGDGHGTATNPPAAPPAAGSGTGTGTGTGARTPAESGTSPGATTGGTGTGTTGSTTTR